MAGFDGTGFDDGDFDVGSVGAGGPGSFYWGPHFPDAAGGVYWYPHFPEGAINASLVDPVGPGAAATFALDIQAGGTITYTFDTEVKKFYDGTEQRASKLDLPRRKIAGSVYLLGSQGRALRARLARFAHLGAPFLLALPFEEMTIIDDATTAVLPVGDTTLIDWNVIGQRAVVFRDLGDTQLFADVTVQSVGPSSITIDSAYEDITLQGSRIIPTVAVYLDPQQGIARFTNPDGIERWAISCTTVLFGYEQDDNKARASLSASTGALHGASIRWPLVGVAGNGVQVTFVADATTPPMRFETVDATHYIMHFTPGATFIVDMIAAFGGVFELAGTYDTTAALANGDAIGPLTLSGGSEKHWGAMGNGAELTMFEFRPVWDRGVTIVSGDTADDSLMSLTTVIDLGGKVANIGQANASDWGRAIGASDGLGEPWQWLKLFLFTVKGRCKSWWLPSYRHDLDAVDGSLSGVYTLKVAGPDFDSGDFFGWYPSRHTHLYVELEDESVHYLEIMNAIDNLDGTISVVCKGLEIGPLTTVAELPDSPITMVSWLELVRFDTDDFQITFSGSTFTLTANAREIQG